MDTFKNMSDNNKMMLGAAVVVVLFYVLYEYNNHKKNEKFIDDATKPTQTDVTTTTIGETIKQYGQAYLSAFLKK
jgi:steroid 5-alpha reductase family enzyme